MCCARLFIYLEQAVGSCRAAEISSFVQDSFVSLSDVQSKMTSCYCPELVTRPGCPSRVQATRHILRPRLTWSTPEGFIPLSTATVSLRDFSTSYRWDPATSALWPSCPRAACVVRVFMEEGTDVGNRGGRAKVLLNLRIRPVVCSGL